MAAAIEVRGLQKSYGPVHAVRGVDLTVDVGEVFALLGPNGAGKTTTVEILEGYRSRDAGEVRVLGFDPARAERAMRQRIGIVLQSTGLDPYLTVAETIEYYRGGYPTPRPLEEILELVGLAARRHVRVRRLSGGQQRRLDVAVALAGDPDVLFLDEPTTGFDPSARRNAWEVIRHLSALGKTVFLTTHYMDEAQYLAGRVAIIAEGAIVAEGPPAALAASGQGPTVIRFGLPPDGPPLPESLRARATVDNGTYELRVEDARPTLHELTGWALQAGADLVGLEVRQPSLEDVYLEITRERSGREGEEA